MLTDEYLWSEKAAALGIEQFDDRIWDEENPSGLASILTSCLIHSCKKCWMRKTNGYVQFLTPTARLNMSLFLPRNESLLSLPNSDAGKSRNRLEIGQAEARARGTGSRAESV